MGYSCTQAAGKVLDKISNAAYAKTGLSNGLKDGGFFEVGRENADGRITGMVWKPYSPGFVVKAGGFCIAPHGKILKFPGLGFLGSKASFEEEVIL